MAVFVAKVEVEPHPLVVVRTLVCPERGSTIAWFVSPYDEVNQAMAEALSERVSPGK